MTRSFDLSKKPHSHGDVPHVINGSDNTSHPREARSSGSDFPAYQQGPLTFRRSQVPDTTSDQRLLETYETGHWSHQRSEEHTPELQSRGHLVCRLLLAKNTANTTARAT